MESRSNRTALAQRLQIIRTLQADVALLVSQVRHESALRHLRTACCQLHGGMACLSLKNLDTRPDLLEIIDLATEVAATHLRLVRRAVQTEGPNAVIVE